MTDRIGLPPTRQEYLEFYAPAVSALPLPLATISGSEKSAQPSAPTSDEELKKLESGNHSSSKNSSSHNLSGEKKTENKPGGVCGRGQPGI